MKIWRYWRFNVSSGPGKPIAEHNTELPIDEAIDSTGNARYVTGPGRYRVIVRAPGKGVADGPVEGARTWPIELQGTVDGFGQPLRFNSGMARWYGLRLIEAAALWEAYETGELSQPTAPRWGEIQEWMRTNAADYLITETPDESIVPEVLRLLTEAKRVLASPPTPALASRDTAIGTMRHIAQRVIDKQTTESAMALADARRDAIAAGHIRAEEFVPLVVEYFTPGQQAILRGKTGL